MSDTVSGKRKYEEAMGGETDVETDGETDGETDEAPFYSIPCYIVRREFAAGEIQRLYRGHKARVLFHKLKLNELVGKVISLLQNKPNRSESLAIILEMVASQKN